MFVETGIYLPHQGKKLPLSTQGENLLLGEQIVGHIFRPTIETNNTNTHQISLNLGGNEILERNPQLIHQLFGYDTLHFQDGAYNPELFRLLQDGGYTVVVVPYTQQGFKDNRPVCMVTAIRLPGQDKTHIEDISLIPLHQQPKNDNAGFARFDRATCDREPTNTLESNQQRGAQFLTLMVATKERVLGNLYMPGSIGHTERARNFDIVASQSAKSIVGDWNIYGRLIDTGKNIHIPGASSLLKLVPNKIARTLGIHSNGDVAPYPIGIGLNILARSVAREQHFLQERAKQRGMKLLFPHEPTISKGPFSMWLDGVLMNDRIHGNCETLRLKNPLSDHTPILVTTQ